MVSVVRRTNARDEKRSGRMHSSRGKFASIIFTVPIMHQVLTFVSPPQETCGRRETEEWPWDNDVVQEWGDKLFRWRHEKAVSTIWHFPKFNGWRCGEVVECRYQNPVIKIFFKNSLNVLYTQPALTCWARYVFMSSAGPRHVGAAGRLIIWRPLQLMFFKDFPSRTRLAKSSEGICTNCW
jgi:hypothetical protein